LIDQYGALPLDEYAKNVASLSDAQMRSLHLLVDEAGLPADFPSVLHARSALRLYVSLSPSQQQAAWRGRILPIDQMTAPQQAAAMMAAQELARKASRQLELADFASGTFRLTKSPIRRQAQTGSARHYRSRTVPGPESSPLAEHNADSQVPVRHRLTKVRFYLHFGTDLTDEVELTVGSSP
jgi:hypothetical protein